MNRPGRSFPTKFRRDHLQFLENSETSRIIGILTERLSSKQKAVFVLSELQGLSNEEISAITGIKKSAVKANLYYARKSISEKIEKYL